MARCWKFRQDPNKGRMISTVKWIVLRSLTQAIIWACHSMRALESWAGSPLWKMQRSLETHQESSTMQVCQACTSAKFQLMRRGQTVWATILPIAAHSTWPAVPLAQVLYTLATTTRSHRPFTCHRRSLFKSQVWIARVGPIRGIRCKAHRRSSAPRLQVRNTWAIHFLEIRVCKVTHKCTAISKTS